MTKKFYTRDEVKALIREVMQLKPNEAVVEARPDEQKTYTLEEVKALIIKDREARNKQ